MTDLSTVSELEKALTFYEVYHSEKRNKIIHFVFVPLLLYTGFVIAFHIHNLIPFLAFLGYSFYYVGLDSVVGTTYIPIMFQMLFYIRSISLLTAILIHVSSWIVQILSHKYFEGRAPAITQGFFQAITIAPLFTWYELYRLGGYKKEIFDRIEKNAKDIVLNR